MEGWFFAGSNFQEHKRDGGDFLTVGPPFQENSVPVQFDFVPSLFGIGESLSSQAILFNSTI